MNKNDITLSVAKTENAQEIHNLMKAVYEKLDDKGLFVCDDLEFVQRHICDEGFTVIALNEANKIIGCFIFRYPDFNKDNLGYDLNLDKNDLQKVVHLESAVVSPEYRGNDLQFKMMKYGENLIDKNKYKYFLATVSPDNPASYKSLEKNGYKLVLTKEKYNGLKRNIYLMIYLNDLN